MLEKTPRSSRRDTVEEAPPGGADRVLASLKALSRYPAGVTLEELARQMHMPKSSLHRALATLRRAGLVDQDARGSYQLGLELVRMAFAYYEARDETRLMRPLLEDMARRFGETAHLARLDGDQIVYLAKVAPPDRGVQMTSVVGGRNPAHATALGKALLAYELPDRAAVDAYVARHGGLGRRTPRTLAEAASLDRELARIRAAGYATEREESETGINCIAYPLFLDSPQRPAAAISVSALAPRTPLAGLEAAATETRALIRRHLGPVLPEDRR